MNEKIKDGGPAFPETETTVHMSGDSDSGYNPISDVHSFGGMTLRDYFAANVMGEASALELEYPTGPNGDASYHGAATRAYLMADAMLRAREVQS